MQFNGINDLCKQVAIKETKNKKAKIDSKKFAKIRKTSMKRISSMETMPDATPLKRVKKSSELNVIEYVKRTCVEVEKAYHNMIVKVKYTTYKGGQ